MAMPRNLEGAATLILQHAHDAARSIRANADAVDLAAAAHVIAAADACADWRRDTTEASRRRTYGAACAAAALCDAPLPGADGAARRLIGAYARAFVALAMNDGAQTDAPTLAGMATRRYTRFLEAHG